jgi:arylformamidase
MVSHLIDITLPLTAGMPVYPGEPGPELTPRDEIARGDPANVSDLSLGTHTGTHVDAPRHFVQGAASVEAMSLDALCGPARVVRVTDPIAIRRAELEQGGLDGVVRVLFQTRNSELWEKRGFQKDFVYLESEAADLLLERGVRLVGIDYLSIEQFHSKEYPVHHKLLGAGVVIVEGLDLRRVIPGDYDLFCLPLKLVGADGAPCRAVLRRLVQS